MASEYHFTEDWFSHNIEVWRDVLSQYKDSPDVKALEVGSFQGRSAIWLLENILTHPSSTLTCVDTFQGSEEHVARQTQNMEDIFDRNTALFRSKNRLTKLKGASSQVLAGLPREPAFDIVYVDASHTEEDTYADLEAVYRLLKPSGTLIVDDYEGADGTRRATDRFQAEKNMSVVRVGWQFIARK